MVRSTLTEDEQKYVRKHRLEESMMDMADNLGSKYNRVRNFMVDNSLMLSKAEVYKIRSKKITEDRPWNWDALE